MAAAARPRNDPDPRQRCGQGRGGQADRPRDDHPLLHDRQGVEAGAHGDHRRDGRYIIRDATLPVSTSFGGRPFPKEITPLRRLHPQRTGSGPGDRLEPAAVDVRPERTAPRRHPGTLAFGPPGRDRPDVPQGGRPHRARSSMRMVNRSRGRSSRCWTPTCSTTPDTRRTTARGYDWKALPGTVRPRRHRPRRRLPIRGTRGPGVLLDPRESPRNRQREPGPSTPRRSTARTRSTSSCPLPPSTGGAGTRSRPIRSPIIFPRSGRLPSPWWPTTPASRLRASAS